MGEAGGYCLTREREMQMTIELKSWLYVPEKGGDIWTTFHTLDYDPKAYKTKAGAAKGLYEALRKAAKDEGQNPDMEVQIWKPGENGNQWRVSWEAGPYEWAIGLSALVTGPWGYTEPYYSFDLCFTD